VQARVHVGCSGAVHEPDTPIQAGTGLRQLGPPHLEVPHLPLTGGVGVDAECVLVAAASPRPFTAAAGGGPAGNMPSNATISTCVSFNAQWIACNF
jgi:hypothetical protein